MDSNFMLQGMIGRNCIHQSTVWVMSEEVQLTNDGAVAQPGETPFLWLRRLVSGNNLLLQESLACKVSTPLDNGEGLAELCLAIRQFMPENFLAAMATLSASIMGANYTTILAKFECCGVPMLTGPQVRVNLRLPSVLCHCLVRKRHIPAIARRHLLTSLMLLAKRQFPSVLMTSVRNPQIVGKSSL